MLFSDGFECILCMYSNLLPNLKKSPYSLFPKPQKPWAGIYNMKSSLLSYFISLVNIPLWQIDLTSSSNHSAIQDNDSDFISCVLQKKKSACRRYSRFLYLIISRLWADLQRVGCSHTHTTQSTDFVYEWHEKINWSREWQYDSNIAVKSGEDGGQNDGKSLFSFILSVDSLLLTIA